MDNEQCAEDEITKAFHQFIPLAITLTLILCPLILWQLLIFLSPPRLSDQFGRPIIPVKKDKTFSALYENSTGISNGGPNSSNEKYIPKTSYRSPNFGSNRTKLDAIYGTRI